ncbi:hypothetical protein [Streptomyces sp. NPDC047043]|uniref:hypothetical protein n=1 Tax=Streptomyces sp. NPDC047043 TaxID=3154497 RepID=UPI0034056946
MATLVAAAGLTLTGAPSAAAADRASFDLTVGATYFRGTIDFYNRSVSVDGVLRGLTTGCRRGAAWANDASGKVLDHRSTSLVCNGAVSRQIPLTADVPGGAAIVEVDLLDADGHIIAFCFAVRGDEYCE